MDRQTLRDWVHRFNERGPDGLRDTCQVTPRFTSYGDTQIYGARR
jgi:Helix-turn-helix domain